MTQYQRFIGKLFLKNFIILFLALELFFTGIDLMQNFKYLPDAANLQIIYASNIFLNFVNYTLPLSLIFAMIMSIFQLIKSNELVSMYALGISKKQVILPIFILSVLITLMYIALNTTAFVQANKIADSIKRYGKVSDTTGQLFLKSFDDYIYIGSLNAQKKEGHNIKIFKTKDGDVREIIIAKKATFKVNHWELHDAIKIQKPDIQTPNAKLTYTYDEHLQVLQGFKPHIITNLFNGKNRLTIQASFDAIKLLNTQHLSTQKIRANLYVLILFPLFAPLAILALFYPLPAQRRGSNIALLSSSYVLGTLLLWGVLFAMSKISTNGSVVPEIGIGLPLLLLSILATYLIYKNR